MPDFIAWSSLIVTNEQEADVKHGWILDINA